MERQAKDGTFYQQVGPDQWSPVTREAKDGTVYKKVGDDQWSPITNTPTTKEFSSGQSAARGAAQAMSFGFADELAGLADAATGKDQLEKDYNNFQGAAPIVAGTRAALNLAGNLYDVATTDKKLSDVVDKYKSDYITGRDESRAKFKKAEEENPSAYKAGVFGGSLASAALPIGSTATLAKAIQTGGRIGALTAYGESEAGNVADAIKDVANGTIMGAAGGAIGKGIENLARPSKEGVKAVSDKLTSKAIGEAEQVLSKETGSIPISESNTIKDAATSAKNKIKSFLNPEVDPSYSEFVDIAKKNGIDPKLLPESVKFGPNSSASRAARSLAEGRFGEESLKKFNAGLDQVRSAYNNKINQFSKGLPVDEITAGKILRDSYDEGVSKFFDQMDITHNTLMDMVPGLKLTPEALDGIAQSLNGVEKFAKGRMLRGITNTQKQQGQQLLNAVESIRAGNGSYKQTVEALRDIGEAAYQSKNSTSDIPVDVQKMRKIYNDLNDGLISSVRSQLGDDVANSLVKNNELMSEFFGDKSLVSKILGDKSVAPENAFKSLLMSGDSQKIEALKKVISPEKWDYLKGAVLENIAKRDPEGNFTFKQLYNSMRSKNSALSSIFTPQELAENAGLVRLGDRFGSPVLSSSGTGASISFQNLAKDVTNLSLDTLALKNANKSLARESGDAVARAKDVSPTIKELPSRVAGVLASQQVASKKGPDKWADDGANQLQNHDSSLDKETLEKLKQSKKGRALLEKASMYKAGDKQLDRIATEIKSMTSEAY